MKYYILAILILFIAIAYQQESNGVIAKNTVDDVTIQQQNKNKEWTDAIKKQIEGKENQPASEVFKNLKIPVFKNFPAGRVLAIMNVAFANSLGTDCTHCHVEGEWDKDDKKQKDIARGMWAMMGETSAKLREITGNQQAFVNCTFCHAGSIIPGKPNPKKG